MNQDTNTIIVGGGLSGLSLAYFLSRRNLDVMVLEASSRLGGRIQTVKGKQGTPLELGATWFSDLHLSLLTLIDELGLKKYPQYSKGTSLFQTKSFEPPQCFFVPEADSPSYRLGGGTEMLIETLAKKIPADRIHLSTTVKAIELNKDGVLVTSLGGKEYFADNVVVCIPPQLAGSTIDFVPELPDHTSDLLPTVQTWMVGAIKFAIEYERPFWREKNHSGMLYSHAGIITEMYDHTNSDGNKFGLTGFLNSGTASYTKEVREKLVFQQLQDLFGDWVWKHSAYYDKIWADEFIVSGNPNINYPHQNNGHPLLREKYMNGKLLFCSSECASEHPGYMEGAVCAAKFVSEQL